MSIHTSLQALIKTSTAITNLIGTGSNARLFYRESNSDTMPYISYNQIANDHKNTFIGEHGSHPVFSFMIQAIDSDDIDTIYNALIALLDKYEGTYSGITYYEIRAIGSRDHNYPENGCYGKSVDFAVNYKVS